jgi:hypothetical protein
VVRFFEGLVDPYGPYEQNDSPPRKLWPFLREYIRPFHAVFAVTAVVSTLVATIDVLLIWYLGHLVDVLAVGAPAEVWASYGAEVLAVGVGILVLRPILSGLNTALLHNAILARSFGGVRIRMFCANPSVGLNPILRGALPTASCKRRLLRVMLCSRPLMRFPLPPLP